MNNLGQQRGNALGGFLILVLIVWVIGHFGGCSASHIKWHKETVDVISCSPGTSGFLAYTPRECRIKTKEGNFYTSSSVLLVGEPVDVGCRNEHCFVR